MAANSKIEWTDRTWNPITGCTRVSAGCDNCYAVTMTKRLEAMGQEKYTGLVKLGKEHFNGTVKCHEDTLLDPLKWRKPQRIFVNSMSDVFHKDVPFEFIDKIFAVMALCPHLTFQVLTKRPERAAEYFEQFDYDAERIIESFSSDVLEVISEPHIHDLGFRLHQTAVDDYESRFKHWPLPNVWVGTSIENQATADERIPHLLSIPAKVRFLSCEPLLGPVNLPDAALGWVPAPGGMGDLKYPSRIHWVICGGESGPNARPMHPDWARSLRDQCQAASVPLFFKQWGEWWPPVISEAVAEKTVIGKAISIHKDARISEGSETCAPFGGYEWASMWRVGKHRAGRILDGRTWDEFPEDRR